MAEGPDQPSAIQLALGGLGGPSQPPAKAPARPWGEQAAKPNQVPNAFRQDGSFKLSIADGGLLRVDVVPPNPETYFELAKLPTRVQRKGIFGVSFWDLPGVQAIAAQRGYKVEFDDKVKDMVERWHRWCLELEWTKTFADFPDFSVPGLDIKFLPFQARGVVYGARMRKFLLGDQMGLGKSIQTLGLIFTWRALPEHNGRLDTLILAPTSVVGDWAKKFRQFAHVEIATADKTKAKRIEIYESKPEFLALSYDTFIRDAVEIARNIKPQCLVADECQRFTNRKSKAAEKLIDFADITQPKYRIPISGSPISNRPDDLWAILRLINPGLAGPATAFESRYLVHKPIWKRGPDGKPQIMQIEYGSGEKKRAFTPMRVSGHQNLDELRMKIAPHVIRRLKKDVLKDLPDKMFERIDIRLGKREREVYEELQVRFAEAMAGVHDEDANGQETTFLTWFTRAQQICSSLEITGDGTESSKIDELKTFCDDYAQDQKILIFSRFKEMTTLVCRELKAFKPIHLNGDIAQNKRQPLVDSFQEDEERRLFVSTLKAGGVGLTLTAGSIVIRLDRWVSPSANDQAVDRAHRIGQTKQVTVVDMIVEDSVEERILAILDKKLKMIASLISADDDEDKQERKIIRALLKKQDMLKLI